MATTTAQNVPKSYRNTGKPWSDGDVRRLKELARENTPTPVIGLKLGRTPGAVQSKASAEGISLAPPNRSPYGRVKSGGAGRSGRGSKSRR